MQTINAHKSIQTFMLIDDNEIDLFISEKLIKSRYPLVKILSFKRADWALDFLKLISISDEKTFPDVIILDLYIPNVDNGFQFLREYELLTANLESKSQVIVLSCSINPNGRSESLSFNSVKEYITKPLSKSNIQTILSKKIKLTNVSSHI